MKNTYVCRWEFWRGSKSSPAPQHDSVYVFICVYECLDIFVRARFTESSTVCFFPCYLECICVSYLSIPPSQPTHHMETVTNNKKRKKVFLWISLVLSGRPDPAITLTVQPAFNAGETTVCIPSAHLTNHILRKTTSVEDITVTFTWLKPWFMPACSRKTATNVNH